jgi:adenylate kinase family enzyme|uniref:Zeta toxin domain-containing protein n=1 Tax=viral metagenome TaxID=1070528 RepID=A0A6C0J6Z0_9ZZZZ|tara:strand:- start:29 stop:556 length:528 start_codon:yes stop_codon:yes gene_type:complete
MIILIIPIGPPGSGKTTLKEHLNIELENLFSTERDYEFSKLRVNNSLKNTNKLLFDKFENFMEEIISTNYKNPESKYYVYLDSSNAKILNRKRIYERLKPEKIVEINFQFPKYILMERVKNRIHPTFPFNPIEQENIVDKIMENIEFSNHEDDGITKIFINQPRTLKKLTQLILV